MIKGFILSSHKVLGTCHEAMGQDMVSVVKLLPLSSGKFKFFAIVPVWLEGQQVKSFSLGVPMGYLVVMATYDISNCHITIKMLK